MRVHAALAAAESLWLAQKQAQRGWALVSARGLAGAPVAWAAALAGQGGPLAVEPGGKADALSSWLQRRALQAAPQAAREGLDAELLQTAAVDERGDDVADAATATAEAGGDGTLAPLRTPLAGQRAPSAAQRAPLAGQRAGRAAREASPGSRSPLSAAAGSARGASHPATARSGVRSPQGSAARVAALALQSTTPKALRAILAALGEHEAPAASDAAAVFAARWLGRPDVANKALAQMAKLAAAAGGGELLAAATETTDEATSRSQSAGAGGAPAGRGDSAMVRGPALAQLLAERTAVPLVAEAAGDGEVVLTGLAALAALTGGALAGKPPRPMQLAETERTLVESASEANSPNGARAADDPTGDSAALARGARGRAADRASAGKLAAVKLHEFAPVGLRRGRNLTGQQRRALGLHSTARSGQGVADVQTTIRNLTRLATARRVGYGAAGLGGGELIGLTDGDGASFFGDAAPSPTAVRGADRLSHAVQQRRAAHPTRGGSGAGASALAKSAPAEPFEGVPVIPSDFRLGDAATAVEESVAASGRSGGATSAMRSSQAAAMTRVLSVTDAPSAHVLPLVAPAAQAVVAAAAAKSWSDALVTSGGDPTMGLPIASTGSRKAGQGGKQGGGGEGGGGGEQADQAQDIEALAMKIARSVMVRIKRERERRGLHE